MRKLLRQRRVILRWLKCAETEKLLREARKDLKMEPLVLILKDRDVPNVTASRLYQR